MSGIVLDELKELKKSQEHGFGELHSKMDRLIKDQMMIRTTLYGGRGEYNGGICAQVKKNTHAIGELKTWAAAIGGGVGAVTGFISKYINW